MAIGVHSIGICRYMESLMQYIFILRAYLQIEGGSLSVMIIKHEAQRYAHLCASDVF